MSYAPSSSLRLLFALCFALGLGACNNKSAGPQISAEARAEATEIFSSRCSVCHGQGGAGDGPASAGLVPKPRNFSDKAWQASVTDEHREKIIQDGGAAVNKSAAMPSNPDLVAKPATVTALRAHVRQLGR